VKGIQWLREQVKDVVGTGSDSLIDFELPIQDYDYGSHIIIIARFKSNIRVYTMECHF
jgi:hypothetical protein